MENLLCLPTVHRTKPALCFLQRVDRCRGHLRTKFHLSPSHAVCYPCCWVCFRCGRRRRQARPALTNPEHREYNRKHVHVCLGYIGYMIVMAGTCVLWASCAWRIKFLIEIHCLWHTADLWFLMSLTTAWQCSDVTHRTGPIISLPRLVSLLFASLLTVHQACVIAGVRFYALNRYMYTVSPCCQNVGASRL